MSFLKYFFAYSEGQVLLAGLGIAFFALLAFLVKADRAADKALGPRAALFLASAWLLLITAPFWVFGPASALSSFGDEGEVSLPFLLHLNRPASQGIFDFFLAGGSDAVGTLPAFNQIFSLQRFLFGLLTPWQALAVNKISVLGLAFLGAHLIARVGYGASRALALIVAAAFSISFFYHYEVTLAPGLGYAMIPLGCYLFTFGLNKRWSPLAIFLFALFASAASTITHTIPALFLAILAAAVLESSWKRARFWVGLLVLVAVVLLNWFPVILAVLDIVAASARVRVSMPFDLEILSAFPTLNCLPLAGLLGVFLLWQPRTSPKCLFVLLLPIVLSYLFSVFPWQWFKVGGIGSLHSPFFAYGVPTLAAMTLSKLLVDSTDRRQMIATSAAAPAGKRTIGGRLMICLLLGMSFGLASAKSLLVLAGLAGGMSVASIVEIPKVREHPLLGNPNIRVAAIGSGQGGELLSDNNLLAYDVSTIGGYANLFDTYKFAFWRIIGTTGRHGSLALAQMPSHCAEDYSFAEENRLALLQLVGVGAVVSRVPVMSTNLHLISGPTAGSWQSYCKLTLRERIQLLRHPRELFVYGIDQPLPMVYFAQVIRVVQDYDLDDRQFWNEVAAVGPQRGAIIKEDLAIRGTRGAPVPTITDWRRQKDGYDIQVEATVDGLLIVNHPPVPNWHSEIDGKDARIVPVNGIQIGIPVPAGSRQVKVDYQRRSPY
ncbi:MAG: hypothetical protein GC191_04960 [Azospirillum sp.]|nr:hypothetical protein [Azospirillum sp.]